MERFTCVSKVDMNQLKIRKRQRKKEMERDRRPPEPWTGEER